MSALQDVPPVLEFHTSYFMTGQWLDVEIENYLPSENDRFKARFIGGLQGQYLLVEQPDARRYGQLRASLKEKHDVIIRAISEAGSGECIAFKVSIQGLINHPNRLMSVAFPQYIERRELRMEKRHLTDIPAGIESPGSGRVVKVTIVDISSGGCRIECPVSDQVRGIKAKQIRLVYSDPVTREKVARVATVRSERKQGNLLVIGTSFEDA